MQIAKESDTIWFGLQDTNITPLPEQPEIFAELKEEQRQLLDAFQSKDSKRILTFLKFFNDKYNLPSNKLEQRDSRYLFIDPRISVLLIELVTLFRKNRSNPPKILNLLEASRVDNGNHSDGQLIDKILHDSQRNSFENDEVLGALLLFMKILSRYEANKEAIFGNGGVTILLDILGSYSLLRSSDSMKSDSAKTDSEKSDSNTNTNSDNPKSVLIQIISNACCSLCNLSLNTQIGICIGKMGGAGLVIEAMSQFLEIPEIQSNAASALANLALAGDNQMILSSAGGVEAVLRAMRTHLNEAEVQVDCCSALCNFSYKYDLNKERIMNSGGLELTITAMDNHPSSVGVQSNACGLLSNLSSSDQNRRLIGESGAITRVIKAMKTHYAMKDFLTSSCGTFGNLSINDDNCMIIIESGGFEELLRIYQDNSIDDDELLDWIKGAANRIVDDDYLKLRVLERTYCEEKLDDILTLCQISKDFSTDPLIDDWDDEEYID